jgi:hypothetical protein
MAACVGGRGGLCCECEVLGKAPWSSAWLWQQGTPHAEWLAGLLLCVCNSGDDAQAVGAGVQIAEA